MGTCIEKLPHDCGSRQGLQVFQDTEGRVDGYCFSCGTYVPDPYNGGEPPEIDIKDADRIQEEIREVATYRVHDLPMRKLRKESLKYFGIRVATSESDGHTPVATYFPYGKDGELFGWKVATIPQEGEDKKQWAIGTTKGAQLFGWARAKRSGQRTLFITEGEYDAVALYQILKDSNKHTEYADHDPAVVSLVNGSGSARKAINLMKEEIDQYFDDVVLVFDMDEPGQRAAEDVCRIAPTYKVASLPCKDANACLMEGASKACKKAVLFQSVRPKNSRLVRGSSLIEAGRKQAEMGLAWPWQGLTDATRGIRRGETIYFGAGVKMGKSEIVNSLAENIIVRHNLPAFIVKPEEAIAKSFKMLCGKAVGKVFHDPNIPFDYEAYDKAASMIGDKAIFQDIYQFVDWDTLREDIRYAVVGEKVHDIFLDPITCFTNTMSASEANEHLTLLAADLSAMAKDLQFTPYIFCHLKAPESGLPHERGGQVFSTQFAGSRAMMRSCNYMIGVEGNKDPELDELERNVRKLKILEDREFGCSDTISLFWDKNTGLFNEVKL